MILLLRRPPLGRETGARGAGSDLRLHTLPVSVKRKLSSGEEDPWEDDLSEHQIRGRRAVSAAGLQGEGLPERNLFVTDTGIIWHTTTCERRPSGEERKGERARPPPTPLLYHCIILLLYY